MTYYPTSQEIADRRKEFYAALRNGRYKQGNGALRLYDTYCCLGVACDISGVGKWTRNLNEEYSSYNTDFSYAVVALIPEVREYYEFRAPDPKLNFLGDLVFASELNDLRKLSFTEIADIFEATYPSSLKS